MKLVRREVLIVQFYVGVVLVLARSAQDETFELWWGFDKARHIVLTALLVRVQRLKKIC